MYSVYKKNIKKNINVTCSKTAIGCNIERRFLFFLLAALPCVHRKGMHIWIFDKTYMITFIVLKMPLHLLI